MVPYQEPTFRISVRFPSLKPVKGRKGLGKLRGWLERKKRKTPNNLLNISLPVSSYDLIVSRLSKDHVSKEKQGSAQGLSSCSSSTDLVLTFLNYYSISAIHYETTI